MEPAPRAHRNSSHNSDGSPVRKVKETNSTCRQGTQQHKADTGGQGARSLRGNLGSAPADPCYLGKQPILLGLQEQNSRFLYKISVFL